MIANDENYLINDNYRQVKSDAYIKYVLPYEKVVNIINCVYEINTESLSTDGFNFFNTNNIKPIDNLTANAVESFYATVNQASTEHVNSLTNLSQNEKEKHLEMLCSTSLEYF
ncbi:hypothetical protein GC105_07340 [Alkalibaculum sp. M08DMB]|uniref:Uncharacterized protein n=1 Tax=Alkalibaculum sporogenes TaxID=2655001 RepID=A0A6A7K8F6_9FIRM|nr:hypothetical protein [Alkalibaculum sporogenes]MPW25601.1 hypothetical protein [Alkalibaculum sporogenes]